MKVGSKVLIKIQSRKRKYFDSYQDLITFTPPDMLFMKVLMKEIYSYNYNNQDNLILPFFKYPLLKVASAVAI